MSSQRSEQVKKELSKLARCQSSARFESDEASEIASLTLSAGLGTRQELVDIALMRLPEVPQEIARIIVGSHEDRYVKPLGQRRKAAARKFGFSAETFRKRYAGKESHYEKLLLSVARAMVAVSSELEAQRGPLAADATASSEVQSAADSAASSEVQSAADSAASSEVQSATDSAASSEVQSAADDVVSSEGSTSDLVVREGTGSSSKTKVLVALAVLALAVLGSVFIVRAMKTRRSETGTSEASATTSLGLTSSSGSGSGDFGALIHEVEPTEGCDFPVGVSPGKNQAPTTVTETFQAVHQKYAEQGQELGCPVHVVYQWQDFWLQDTHPNEISPTGVLLKHDDMDEALWVEQSLWTGYMRQMSGQMYEMEGVPVYFEMYGQYPRLLLESGAEIISVQIGGAAKYLPSLALELWGGIDGDLGLPLSDVHYYEGYPKLEFERGHMVMKADDQIEAFHVSQEDIEKEVAKYSDVELPGIVRGFDGTAWYVDGEGVRHWIPDAEEWFCAGGDDAVVISDIAAWALIELYPLGDIVTCADFS